MKTWNFNNKILVKEVKYDYDLHIFEVYLTEEDKYKFLGEIYPGDIETMEECIKYLDNGNDPIENKWEDGNGNTCTIDGWYSKYECEECGKICYAEKDLKIPCCESLMKEKEIEWEQD